MKNGKIANVNVDVPGLFLRWVELTKPFHKLSGQLSSVLGLLLYHNYRLSKSITDEDLTWKMVFSYETKNEIKESLDIKGQHLQNILTTLRKKNIIKNNQVVNTYVPNLEHDAKSFSIIFNLNIKDNG
jgi:hypothetical protein